MIAQFSVFPLGEGVSIRSFVAKALEEVEKSGLPYRVTDMGTIVEGDWDAVTALLKKVHDRVLAETDRVYMTVSLDDRRDKKVALHQKVRSVEAVFGKKLS